MKNTIQDLRNSLFATLETLDDPNEQIDVQQVKAKVAVANAIISTAKVEIDFAKLRDREDATKGINRFLQIEN